MSIVLEYFLILFLILGVVFIYPLIFSKKPNQEPSKSVQFVYYKSTYRPELSKVLKLAFALIIPALLHVLLGSSNSIEFSKETYAFLAAIATILVFLI